jgi:hypothetical protein
MANKSPPRTETRIYLVNDGKSNRLIRAPNSAQAIRHCAKAFTAHVPSQDELLAASALGTKVEEAGAVVDSES